MGNYYVSQINLSCSDETAQVDELLSVQKIKRDQNLDCCIGVFDSSNNLLATGSCFKNTLRCIAVSPDHVGEGLMEIIVSRLCEIEVERGYTHYFVYTKYDSAKYFKNLGFYEIISVEDKVTFLENKRNGFASYLKTLSSYHTNKSSCAIVMNSNPFTYGHQYLVESASKEFETVHVFVVSEDCSLVPFSIRKKLVERGCAHLDNVFIHSSGDYIISSATFPSYFFKDDCEVIRSQAMIDATVFIQIAKVLGIQCRFLGSEPLSGTTALYNDTLSDALPAAGIECRILPRLTAGNGNVISASKVRQLIRDGQINAISEYVPSSTFDFFRSPEAVPVITAIQS